MAKGAAEKETWEFCFFFVFFLSAVNIWLSSPEPESVLPTRPSSRRGSISPRSVNFQRGIITQLQEFALTAAY